MDYICLSAAALWLKKTPTTTRKSINTCYSQIRSYLGSKVPAGKVKTKPPVSLSAFSDSLLPARGWGGGCFIFYLFRFVSSRRIPERTLHPRCDPAARAVAARGARSRPRPRRSAAWPGRGSRSVPGARLPPAALLPWDEKRAARGAARWDARRAVRWALEPVPAQERTGSNLLEAGRLTASVRAATGHWDVRWCKVVI